jgi:heptose I phosphotransferase
MKTIVEIEPIYDAALRAAGLEDFDAMMAVAGGTPVGWHHHRETLPIEIAIEGQPRRFYLKRVFKVPPKHAFWPLLRGRLGRSQPWLEWHMLGELREAGIPAMRRVAFGERRRFGMPTAAFLLVESVLMPHTLEHWLVPGFPKPPAIAKRLRDRLVRELGALVGTLRTAGFAWPDIHAKHIFAAPRCSRSTGPAWEFCLIDVERMARTASSADPPTPLPADVATGQLTLIMESLQPMPLTRHDLRRFFAGYYGRDRMRAGSPPAVLAACSVDGSCSPRLPEDYEHPRHVGLVRIRDFQVDPRAAELLAGANLRNFQDFLGCRKGKSLRKPGLQSYRDRIRLELPDKSGERHVLYMKTYLRPPLREQLRRIWETQRSHGAAWREVHFARKLARLGIPTLHPIAFGERMRGIWEQASFAMTADIKGESLENLARRAATDASAMPSWRERVEIIRQLALIVRRLHENRLFHRDLYLSHVFLKRNTDGAIVLQLIDLARMLENPLNRGRWQVKDLASLEYSAPPKLVTRADRLRFLYDYHLDSAHSGGVDRRLIRAVLARTQRMAWHDASRARRFERDPQEHAG